MQKIISTSSNQDDIFYNWTSPLAAMGYGIIIFAKTKEQVHHNVRAQEYLSKIWAVDMQALNYTNLVSQCYEYAIDISSLPPAIQPLFDSIYAQHNGFAEILRGHPDNYILARFTQLNDDHVMVMIEDFTARVRNKKEQYELTWQHKILLDAIEESQTGMVLFDPGHPDNPIVFSNQAFCHMMGVQREKALGTCWKNFFPEYESDGTYKVIVRVHDDIPKSYAVQISIYAHLGIIFLSDISDIRAKEAQMLHMQRIESLGQLAGGVAHDFNNILGIINGYGHLLKKWALHDERAEPAVNSILNACLRGTSLSNKLLAFSHAKQAKHNECILQPVLNQLRDLLRPLLPATIAFEIFYPEHDITVKCSDDHLMQIFMNLVINARDAMANGGNITIDCSTPREDDKKITITVRDNGSGIAPDILTRIFEPFFTTKPVGKGTGLGLSVIYGLIQQNNGAIQVTSKLNEGTMFVIEFPIIPKGNVATIRNNNEIFPTNADLSFMKDKVVMLVDDEDDLRTSLKLFFEDLGANVIEAASSEDALSIQDTEDIDIHLLVSDVRMPGLYGDELARLWRDIRPKCKIILMSGYTENRTPNPEYYDYLLEKPIDYKRMTAFLSQSMKAL